MTEQQFVYWLQGFAELNEQPPSTEQWKSIREHLALVFNKVTPPAKMSVELPDVSNSDAVKSMIEKARRSGFVEPPLPLTPYQPYFLDQRIRPGELTC